MICWRSTYSRWLRSISDWTCDWMRDADRHHLELAREDLGQAAQPAGDVELLEQLLLFSVLDAQRAGDQVRERGRVVDVGNRHLQLLGQVRDLLDDVRERLLDVAREGRELGPLLHLVGRLLHARHEVGLASSADVGQAHALAALDEDAQRAVGDLEHPRDGADDPDAVELVGAGASSRGRGWRPSRSCGRRPARR